MIRRWFRIGLRVGLLGGIAAAAVKMVQSRRSTPAVAPSPAPAAPPPTAPNADWPPLQPEPTPVAPEAPAVEAEVETPAPVRKAAAKKAPAAKKAAGRTRKAAAPATAWVEPTGSVCPPSHPVKAKLSSRLYHLPGMFAYARTVPDRCYGTAEEAEGDGLVKAKR